MGVDHADRQLRLATLLVGERRRVEEHVARIQSAGGAAGEGGALGRARLLADREARRYRIVHGGQERRGYEQREEMGSSHIVLSSSAVRMRSDRRECSSNVPRLIPLRRPFASRASLSSSLSGATFPQRVNPARSPFYCRSQAPSRLASARGSPWLTGATVPTTLAPSRPTFASRLPARRGGAAREDTRRRREVRIMDRDERAGSLGPYGTWTPRAFR